MAQKTITELQLKASVLGDESLPVDNGIQTYRVTPSQMFDYMRSRLPAGSVEALNISLVPSVGSSALTIALKTKSGANASATDPIRVGFRSATLTSGLFELREITGALSVVVSSGSTLGQVDAQPSRIWVYLIDNAGTPELAVSHSRFFETSLVSTTAEGGAGGADSATVMYSTTARSNVACRCIGYIDNTQTTAGTWASTGSQIQLLPFFPTKAPTIQRLTSGSSTYYTPAGCTRIRVKMAGGGGGGGGGGTSGSANATAGGNTTFGTALLTANGGAAAAWSGGGGGAVGGAPTVNSPALAIVSLTGGAGGGSTVSQGETDFQVGSHGGQNAFGGGGGAGAAGANGLGGQTNSGGGGGGAGSPNSATAASGPGGGAGAYIEALIVNPLASYAYAVGASGTGETGASANGGAGGSGVIIVEEFYD